MPAHAHARMHARAPPADRASTESARSTLGYGSGRVVWPQADDDLHHEPAALGLAAAAGPAPASPQTSNDQIAAGLLLGFGRACSQNSGDSSELVGFVEDVTSRAAGPPPPPPES